MTRSSSTALPFLRRLSASFCSRSPIPCSAHHVEKSSTLNFLEEAPLWVFSHQSVHKILRGKGNVKDAKLQSISHGLSQLKDSLAIAVPSMGRSATRMNETLKLKLQDQRRPQNRYAASTFLLHPVIAMPYRGFASRGPKLDVSPHISSTNPPDDAGNGTHGIMDWIGTTYNEFVDSIGQAVHVIFPPIRTFLDTYPVIQHISIPVFVFTGAWIILPRVLRRVHGYMEQGSAAFQSGTETIRTVPYEQSVWKAMEDPARLFATLLTGLQIGVIVSPNIISTQFVNQFWSGVSLLCVVWFLHRWKHSLIKGLLTDDNLTKEDRERYLGLDKFASLTLISIGALGFAEAAGVAVSSLLAVGGIGGIATAFAAREILANLLTGLILSFSKSFSPGDSIKAGTVEGKVEVVGLTTTRLLNSDKSQIIVPNAYFTSQAIINKSRAPWRVLSVKIPICLQDFEKVPVITLEIREMLYRNNQVYLDEDKPLCYIAQFTPSALEIAISCNIKPMSTDEYRLVEQDVLVEAARIITATGATLGGQIV